MIAPDMMKALHPVAKSPMIEDDGRIVIESGAIAEHIIERYGNGRLAPAPGTQAHERYRQWLYFAVSSGMNPIMIKVYARAFGLGGDPIDQAADPMAADAAAGPAILDQQEGDHQPAEDYLGAKVVARPDA